MSSSSHRKIPTIDRISDLSDSILCHILSFLPTQQAATTTILSKRWKTLWLSVLTLHFDDQSFKFHTFRNFVSSTLFKLRHKNVSIHSFTFKCGPTSNFFRGRDLIRILKFVNQRGVQNLSFDMSKKNHQIKFPLSCKTLKILKLTNLEMGRFDCVHFPCVKTLYMNFVSFKNWDFIVKFLLGFPVLENLQTYLLLGCIDKRVENFNLNGLPNLVNVTISNPVAPMFLVCKTKILQVQTSLTFWPKLPVFHNLTHLELSIHSDIGIRHHRSLLGILPHFPKLQHLNIQDHANIEFGCICWLDPPTIVPECLSSQLKICYIRSYRSTESYLEFVRYIMQHSQVLETMRIKTTSAEKNQMLLKSLSSCTMGSTTCKLLLNDEGEGYEESKRLN